MEPKELKLTGRFRPTDKPPDAVEHCARMGHVPVFVPLIDASRFECADCGIAWEIQDMDLDISLETL